MSVGWITGYMFKIKIPDFYKDHPSISKMKKLF